MLLLFSSCHRNNNNLCRSLRFVASWIRLNLCTIIFVFHKSKYRKNLRIARIEFGSFRIRDAKQNSPFLFFYSFSKHSLKACLIVYIHGYRCLSLIQQKAITRISSAQWWASTHPYFMFCITFWHLLSPSTKNTKHTFVKNENSFYSVVAFSTFSLFLANHPPPLINVIIYSTR